MARVVEPPREMFDQLLTPLTDGERKVIDLFDRGLPCDWEIYIQPHLNGLRPDIVLLHPFVGVAVMEVKDWNLDHYWAEKDAHGRYVLMASGGDGKTFRAEADNPINKILLYKEELFGLYCPRLDDRVGFAAISAGLIFPCSPREQVRHVFEPFRQANERMQKYPKYYPISGSEDVSSGDVAALFPESQRIESRLMNSELAQDLRGWLREPFFARQQRQPLELDAEQNRLANTRTRTGYRRIKGPAGSGKSVVVAARASTLAAEDKHTLVVSFNITLVNYLRDLAVRHKASRQTIRRQIDFLNFHYWCKRICRVTGNSEEYDRLWLGSEEDSVLTSVLDDRMALLIQRLYREDEARRADMPRYDAILVDEGQDFQPSWWQALKLALKPGGEMVMVADKTQDIYSRAAKWTEDVMTDAGFRGRWSELVSSYRLPPRVVPLVRKFAEEFMRGEDVDVPNEPDGTGQMELFPIELRWVNVRWPCSPLEACDAELRRMMTELPDDGAFTDITFLTGNQELGSEFADMQARKGLELLHTFDEDRRNSRRKKLAFFQGAAKIKATTPHSFKGWEARLVILHVSSMERREDRALFYSALTRVLRHRGGSSLTVVSSCDELRGYGAAWPDRVEWNGAGSG